MTTYVDGFVLPLPRPQIDRYREMAETAADVWREHGALEYRECLLEDPTAASMVAFPQLAGAGANETVVLAWIVYRSREHRDEVNARVMQDPRMAAFMTADAMPFDCQRMAYGGFQTLVERR